MTKRNRRSYSDIFVDKLREWSKGEQRLFGNKALRTALGWDQKRYDRIKWQLVTDEQVIVGRGKGGSVGLGEISPSRVLSMFIAYSHVDEELKNELLKHLEPLKKLGLIDAWHDQKIKAGDEWDKSISKNLERANVVLLLVSIDFINSKYCNDVELVQALAMHEAGQAVVIPVILRACLWQHSGFAKLQAVPKNGKPVCSWANRDEALMDVADEIKKMVDEKVGNQ
jgi:hypothetical protein